MLLALVGPTATGKSAAGIELAGRLGAEIISIDSMLVYRGMDVGTAKPTLEERARVPHHLIDVADPGERWTVSRFSKLGREVVDRVRIPLAVGGSGLYYRALVDELAFPPEDLATRVELERQSTALGGERLHRRLATFDPTAAAGIDPGNVRRTVRALEVAAITGRPFSSFAAAWDRYEPARVRAAGVAIDGPNLLARIERRVDGMVGSGLVEEVRRLVERGFGGWLTSSQAIGYAEFAKHVGGELSLDEAVELTVRRTKNLARRQMAWFRRDPRIRWFEAGGDGAIERVDDIEQHLRDG